MIVDQLDPTIKNMRDPIQNTAVDMINVTYTCN